MTYDIYVNIVGHSLETASVNAHLLGRLNHHTCKTDIYLTMLNVGVLPRGPIQVAFQHRALGLYMDHVNLQ